MEKLKIGKNGRRLETESGLPVFLLADSVPGALLAADDRNWSAYLEFRKSQGFNAVLFEPQPAESEASRIAELIAAADAAGFYVLPNAVAFLQPESGDETSATNCSEQNAREPEDRPSAYLVDATTGTAEVSKAYETSRTLPIVAICAHDSVRFPSKTRRELRSDLWHAILAGAIGGVVYQAAELFDWSAPAPALQLPAAEDFAFAGQAITYFDLTWGEPWPEILAPAARIVGGACARTSSTALIYLPSPFPIELQGDFSEVFVQALDLTSGEGARLDFELDAAGHSHLPAHPFAEDALYVIRL